MGNATITAVSVDPPRLKRYALRFTAIYAACREFSKPNTRSLFTLTRITPSKQVIMVWLIIVQARMDETLLLNQVLPGSLRVG